ncbi:MAG TPA: Xaa-Pro peptidase family protein [Candidatus Polarisedimenticolaceae bacterium]|nr:Xaa-Pro peptidase family protein [Candidatus Polarisedimenticolaceae bacterium]
MHKQRLDQIRNQLKTHGVDALLLTHLPMIRWAIGFAGSSGLLYVDANQALFISDTRYATKAAAQVTTAKILMGSQGQLIPSLLPYLDNIKRIGYSDEHLTVSDLSTLQKLLPAIELAPISELLEPARAVKSAEEIEHLEQAQSIGDQVFSEMLDIIKAGMTEKEIAAELVYRLLKKGADQIPEHFWPIVASGPNSAMIHIQPTDRKLAQGDVLLLDYGCVVNGYTSDMTRTIALGSASDKFKKIYDVVLNAQASGIKAARAGISGVNLDMSARKVVESAGYEIPHGVGHSLGLEIHEWLPLRRIPDPLPENAVITIEPGIYIPGEFGVRIEDIVLLQKNGSRNLTASPKELIIL